MVDFQSRDTRRGPSDDEEDKDDDEETATGETESEDPTDEEAAEQAESLDGEPGDTEGVESTEPEATEPAESEATEPADPETTEPAESEGVDPLGESDHNDEEASHGHDHSHHHGVDVRTLGVAVVTVSSSRTREDDPSGDAIQSLVEESTHEVVTRELVGDDLDGVQRAVLALTAREDVDVVVTTGGTGVTPDDVTIEAVEPLFDKELPGFGELFRILSYEDVGTRALGSRATAGISEGVAVFCLPGSEAAVELGMEELVLAEAGHLVGLAQRE
jgi:molybdenum cofactor biosynthesis protein B